MVALVQTASTLPVFLLGLPSGALADIVDRRRYFAATQLWVSVNALLLAGLSLAGQLTAPLLLLLTFSNGIGLALRWPVFAAIVPQTVTRDLLPQALALNGIAMNLSRVVGPVLAGVLISTVSPAAVFVLNALLAGVAFTLVLRWRGEPVRASALPGERFVGRHARRPQFRLAVAAAEGRCCCASSCSSCRARRWWRCCRWWRCSCTAAGRPPSR